MKKKLLLLLILSFTMYGNLFAQGKVEVTKNIMIQTVFVEPLKVTLNAQDLVGTGFRGIAGTRKLDPILIEFYGKEKHKAKFSVEKEIELVGDQGDNLTLRTTIVGGNTYYNASRHESLLDISNGEEQQILKLGGEVYLTGKEKSNQYLGILNIALTYD